MKPHRLWIATVIALALVGGFLLRTKPKKTEVEFIYVQKIVGGGIFSLKNNSHRDVRVWLRCIEVSDGSGWTKTTNLDASLGDGALGVRDKMLAPQASWSIEIQEAPIKPWRLRGQYATQGSFIRKAMVWKQYYDNKVIPTLFDVNAFNDWRIFSDSFELVSPVVE